MNIHTAFRHASLGHRYALGPLLTLFLTGCFSPWIPEPPPGPPPSPPPPDWYAYNTVRYVATSAVGDLFVAGDKGWNEVYLNRYDRTGDLIWTRMLEKQVEAETIDRDVDALSVSPDGELYVAWSHGLYGGNSVYITFYLTAYDPEGEVRWQVETGGVQALAADSLGNIYASEGGTGYITKYSPTGEKAWSLSDFPTPQAVAISSSNDLYVVRDDGVVAKYSSEGEQIWLNKALTGNQDVDSVLEDCPPAGPCPIDVTDVRYRAAPGPNNSLYVTGGAFRYKADGNTLTTEGGDLGLYQFGGDGTLIWDKQVEALQERFENEAFDGWIAFDLDVDAVGDAYVATGGVGEDGCELGSCIDTVVSRFKASGERAWRKSFGIPGLDGATGVAAGKGGDVFVGGLAGGTLPAAGGDPQARLLALDGKGEMVWEQRVFDVPATPTTDN